MVPRNTIFKTGTAQTPPEDRKMLEGMLVAIKKLSEKFPEVRKVLNNFGL